MYHPVYFHFSEKNITSEERFTSVIYAVQFSNITKIMKLFYFQVQKLFHEVILSFIGGLIFALAVEQPALSIQKMYLPQIKRKKAETEKE